MCNTLLEEAVDLCRRLVDIPSISGEEAAVIEFLETWCGACGLSLRRQEIEAGRHNLLAWRGDPPLWFSTHVDTVPPFIGADVGETAIHGRGACDTKGGIACMLLAGRRLLEEGFDLGFLFVVGEETDHIGADRAGEEKILPGGAKRSIILCEPTEMRIARAQKGVLKLDLSAEGRAAHSALPHLGNSAVDILLRAVEILRGEDWGTDKQLGETFLNLGRIEGGVASNVIPPRARAELLFRTVRPYGEMSSRIDELLSGSRLGGLSWSARNAGEPQVFQPPGNWPDCLVPFGTDAEFLSPLGEILLVGPGRIEVAHGKDEHIRFEELEDGLRGYEKLARELLARTTR